jgi:UDP:flavonoid glycosyltransferase YjiC (YdhE family)
MIRKRILFIGEAVTLAHVARPFFLAESLDSSLYEVHFACDLRYKALISLSESIHYWPLNSLSSQDFIKAADRDEYAYSKSMLEGYLHDESRLIESIDPCFIVGDYRYTLSTSSELYRIPYAAIANIHHSPYRINEFPKFPTQKSVSALTKKIIRRLIPWGDDLLEKQSLSYLNVLRKERSLTPIRDFCDLLTRGNFTLYADAPGYFKTVQLPSNHLFLGPILWSPNIRKPEWWLKWDEKEPLIYVTLGSSGRIENIAELIQELSRMGCPIVLATAGRIQLEEIPANIFVADYLPGLDCCRHASAVLCNGGSATAYQALSLGKPVVGAWSNIDQYLTMKMIELEGAGIGFPIQRLKPEKVADMLSKVISGATYRESASKFENCFKKYDARIRFQNFIKDPNSFMAQAAMPESVQLE